MENKEYINSFDSYRQLENAITSVVTSANWNKNTKTHNRAMRFLLQNQKQFWVPEEIALTRDVRSWNKLSDDEKKAYMQVLGGLTMLDTLQGDIGMPSISEAVDNHYDKTVLTFMAAMENSVHARTYSVIFNTLATQEENDDIFDWLEDNKFIQAKANIIKGYYDNVKSDNNKSIMLGMFASIMLESFLFYSGFFYPLYFHGKGQLTGSGEMIKLILRDESIHGVYVGELFQDRYNELSEDEQKEMKEICYNMMFDLYENEIAYTHYVYDKVGLSNDVLDFLKYNANKALQNAGFPEYYEHGDLNPLVMRSISGEAGAKHDFFSAKGAEYLKANVEPLDNKAFDLSDVYDKLGISN